MAGPLNLSEHGPEPEHSPCVRTSPADPAPEAAEFAAYLDAVCARLPTLASEAWIADLRAELACHLECTADAYEELGETREQATRSACRSLGNPSELGRRWERYWQEKRQEPLRKTIFRAIVYLAAATLLHTVVVFCFGDLLFSPDRVLDPAIPNAFLIPLVTGVLIARRARGRGALETALVTGMSALGVAALTAVLAWSLPGPDPDGLRTLLWETTLVMWLPLAMAAAGVTRLADSLRRRTRLQRGQ